MEKGADRLYSDLRLCFLINMPCLLSLLYGFFVKYLKPVKKENQKLIEFNMALIFLRSNIRILICLCIYHNLKIVVSGLIVRHKINLTWNCDIKFFSLQILVGLTLPIKILDDDSLSSLSILRNSRWRPRCLKIMKIHVLLYNVPLKMNENAMFPHNLSMYY